MVELGSREERDGDTGYVGAVETGVNDSGIPTAQSPDAATVSADKPAAADVSWASVPLESLAPRYEEAQHETYLNRLEEAIRDPANLNIALTGRYGTGKSSVLDKFKENHDDKTLRLAISTLGPDPKEATLTNRIQKELVKQLLYSASPGTLRNSRFSHIRVLSKTRAFLDAAGAVGTAGLLLALLGWLPPLADLTVGQHQLPRPAAWAILISLIVLIATVARLMTNQRVFVSKVSAAGASVTLSEQASTYFDEYLDEIVHFFYKESPNIVIFEDLDRFDDPKIFEALRELNTLLNNTPERVKKNKPLRFVYAVRDSLFEKLGTDMHEEGDDAATAETIRANRTKFFDIVIPVVPFISHQNARELLSQLLQQANITDIHRRLVDLVAQHATDMRILVNIRNEFLVFAERLLEADARAPGLTSSNVFALVTYKNFHLEDFEQISRHGSDLDRLYSYHRDLVRLSISEREKRKRDLLAGRARARSMVSDAKRIGTKLQLCGEAIKRDSRYSRYPNLRFRVGSRDFASDDLITGEFWDAIVRDMTVSILAGPPGNEGTILTLNRDELQVLLLGAGRRWDDISEEAVRDELAQLDRDIAFLRGANFHDLAGAQQYKITIEETDRSFAQLVDATMKSNLARDLVKHGYLDRNFTLYAAQFYGHFIGIDVATFIVQTVQTNTMDINYRFTSPGAVENLLEETSEAFPRTVSAFNIAILDHLLESGDQRADVIVDHMISDFREHAREFMMAYLTSGEQRPRLAARLSSHGWRATFSYLIRDEGVPDDVRPRLVDAALLAADPEVTYDLGSHVADFIVEHYPDMSAFTQPHDESVTCTIVALLEIADVLIPVLEDAHKSVRTLLVKQNLYHLTAANLRAALGITGAVSLDRVGESKVVYDFCLANPSDYLAAVERDNDTPYTVLTPETLAAVLSDVAEHWDQDQVERLVDHATPDSALHRLVDVPTSAWRYLAAAGLFHASLANLEAYRRKVGQIDKPLATLLLNAGRIYNDDEESGEHPDKAGAAVALINARSVIEDPASRVALVRSLDVDDPLPVVKLEPEASDLLGLLLEYGLVEDDATAFNHFRAAGWAALEPAILASSHIEEFLTPDLVQGMVADLFGSTKVRDKVGRQVLEALDQFVPEDDGPALAAAAGFAVDRGLPLPVEEVRRVAATGEGVRDVILELLQIATPAPTWQQIVSTLTELGKPYSHLTTRTKTSFEVPEDDAHRAVFQTLEAADVCTVTKKRNKPLLVVKLL